MKSLLKLTIGISAALFLCFSSESEESRNGISELSRRIQLASKNWKLLVSQAAQEPYETLQTYLPDLGIRGKYHSFKKIFQITFLEKLTGEKIYLKGPHAKGSINFNHPSNFGYYNPKFLNNLESILEKEFGSDEVVKVFQDCYDKNFKQIVRVFYKTRMMVMLRPDIEMEYTKLLQQIKSGETNESASFFLQEKFRPFTEVLKNDSFYEVVSCSSFWVRRSIDGTQGKFKSLLDLILSRMDPGFLSLMEKSENQ